MDLKSGEGKFEKVSSSLKDLTFADCIDGDSRPSFVIDLNTYADIGKPALTIALTNKAYRVANIALEDELRQALIPLTLEGISSDASAFIVWVNSTQCNGCSQYRGYSWTATTVFARWRVIAGDLIVKRDEAARKGTEESARRDSISKTTRIASNIHQYSQSPEKRKSERLKLSNPLEVLRFRGSASQEHCRFVEDFDWSSTPLRSIQDWSQTTLASIVYMLCNPDPCVLFMGPERTIVYNESYTPLIGALHPAAMGSSAKINFGSFWPPFEELLKGIDRSGCAAKQDTYRSVLDRSGVLEELFFRGTFVPILDSSGSVCGISNHVTEITTEVISQRRMKTLLKVTEETSAMIAPDRLWQRLLASMQTCPDDLPFVAIYSANRETRILEIAASPAATDSQSGDWHLEGSIGFPRDHPAARDKFSAAQDADLGPALRLLLASRTGRPLLIRKSDDVLPVRHFRSHTDPEAAVDFSGIVLCPISPSSQKNTILLVFAIQAAQRYDAEYEQFLILLSHQVEDIATSALLLQNERLRAEQTVAEAERQQDWLSKQLVQQTKEAQASEFRFYNFAEHAPVAVFIIGPDGAMQFGNNAFYSLLGIPPGDRSLQPWRRHIHPVDLETVDLHWEQQKEGKGPVNTEFRVVRNSSNNAESTVVTYLRSTTFPELAEDGELKSVTGIMVDDSARRSQELAVADRLADALEAKRAQENFMDMVSHEMRNPLSAMLQCAEEVSQDVLSLATEDCCSKLLQKRLGTMTEALNTIQWCGRHQRQIIDDVLTISKLDSDLLTLAPVETIPADIIGQVLKMFASEAKAADIKISLSISSDSKHQHCMLDSSRVLQILINLVGNAVKFTKDREVRKLELSITTSSEKPQVSGTKFVSSEKQRRRLPPAADPSNVIYVLFSVKDTGPGLTIDEMDSLFARFKQASPRTHAQYGGSGLGLFISRELAEMHGGKIGLNSRIGEGSEFSFYVEAHAIKGKSENTAKITSGLNGKHQTSEIATETSRSNSPSVTVPSPSSITLLIVEDNLINQRVLVRQIRKLGFQTVTANDGQEALAIVKNSNWCRDRRADATDISVILCDLEMPVMDGMTCIRHIRQWQSDGSLEAHVPVVAVTGNARAEQVKAARDAGFDDVVCKPYSVPDLVPIIYRLSHR